MVSFQEVLEKDSEEEGLWNIQAGSASSVPASKLKTLFRASLVAQWLRICLPMQGTRVQALVREDPTCRGATKPVRHNY